MGWNTSIVAGGPWEKDLVDSLVPGFRKTDETTDFGSASTSDSTGKIGIGILPCGTVVAASHSEYEGLNDIALSLSGNGKAGVFHLGSTGGYYEYHLYEFGGSIEHRISSDDEYEQDEDEYVDPDDALALLDEEDGLGPIALGEDGLLDLFLKTLNRDDWSWESELVMYYYEPTPSQPRANN